MSCKYCKDEFCVNADCPLCADYCPVIDVPGVCKYEVLDPLWRFLEAQSRTYEDALKEIKAGHKETHWMWWIFPQYKGIGESDVSKHYAIQSREEAMEYMKHPVLGMRLQECMMALLELETDNAVEVFGEVDAMKLKSCMTLFYLNGGMHLCCRVLDKFFPKELDYFTANLLLNGK